MLQTITGELAKHSIFSRPLADQVLDYERALSPTRHTPDFHFRWKNDLFPSTVGAHVMFEIKRKVRASKPNPEAMRRECLGDTISYGSARYTDLVVDLEVRGRWEGKKIKNNIVVYSLGATPEELVAVRISLPRPCRSTNTNRIREDMALMVCRTEFLQIDGDGGLPGPGFALLVKVIAAGPRALAVDGVVAEPKTEWAHRGGTISLEARLGVGASSETYKILHEDNECVLKIAKHAKCVSLIRSEASVLRSLNYDIPVDVKCIPRLCAEYEGGIVTSPLGMPLANLHGELWASQFGEERELELSMVQGRLALAFFVLENIVGALRFAISRGICHADIRVSNIVVAESHCVLIDWGHSGELGSRAPQGLGAPRFAPNEFAQNPVLSPAVDCCMLAAVVWQLLKASPGKLPWDGQPENFPSYIAYLGERISEQDDFSQELLSLLMEAQNGSPEGMHAWFPVSLSPPPR